MYKITDETINRSFKPFDVVTDGNGSTGFIQEVSVNHCQPEPHQISYSVCWLVGNNNKHAWFKHSELKKHCNLFVKIAENSCHPMGGNRTEVNRLLGGIGTSYAVN